MRTVKKPSKPDIHPQDADVLSVFAYLAEHSELSLSRREIIKFILCEDGKRSTDVQSLLRLEGLDQARTLLMAAKNRLHRAEESAKAILLSHVKQVQDHLGSDPDEATSCLDIINARRAILGLAHLSDFNAGVCVIEGISEQDRADSEGPSKEAILRHIASLIDASAQEADPAVKGVTEAIAELEANPHMTTAMNRLALLELGTDLIDANECPLCELPWDPDLLREQLEQRIVESRAAKNLRDCVVAHGEEIAGQANRLARHFEALASVPEAVEATASLCRAGATGMAAFAENMTTLSGVRASITQLRAGWARLSPSDYVALELLAASVGGRSEKSDAGAARDFLVLAQQRLDDSWNVRKAYGIAQERAVRAERAHSTFVAIADKSLSDLYTQVEGDFAAYYSFINSDDERSFTAKLTPEGARLGFAVDFYGKGLFPPGAYHSEGHQDGMGICLYLALVKQALGNNLTLVVLDDVVMSVDASHRRKFCELLKREFPFVQFVITTHDEVWARQMRSVGVVESKGVVTFHSWDVEHGPLVESTTDSWDRIREDLIRNDVPSAAAKLRRYLEFATGEIANDIAALVRFRSDGSYDLGDKLDAVLTQQKSLIKKAVKVAQSWAREDVVLRLGALKDTLSAATSDKADEQWLINKAVHYNEWASLVKADFEPVVDAFRILLDAWRCPACMSSLTLSSRINPTNLRCSCGTTDFNLIEK